MCGNCSSRKFLLPDISMKPIRVCDTCYEKLSSGAAKPTDELTPEEKAATLAMQSEQGTQNYGQGLATIRILFSPLSMKPPL